MSTRVEPARLGAGRPVIFLDIDGVLNINPRTTLMRPIAFRKNGQPYRPPPIRTRGARAFSQSAVALFNHLAKSIDALVVLSSSWRLRGDVRGELADYGLLATWHSDWRTDDDDPHRGGQVGRWLHRHGDPWHVIIDDSAYEFGDHLDRLVHVNYRTGFRPADAEHARSILGI